MIQEMNCFLTHFLNNILFGLGFFLVSSILKYKVKFSQVSGLFWFCQVDSKVIKFVTQVWLFLWEISVVSCWSVLCVCAGICVHHIPLFCIIKSRTSLDCDKFPYTRVASSMASILELSTNFNITEIRRELAEEKREMGEEKGTKAEKFEKINT